MLQLSALHPEHEYLLVKQNVGLLSAELVLLDGDRLGALGLGCRVKRLHVVDQFEPLLGLEALLEQLRYGYVIDQHPSPVCHVHGPLQIPVVAHILLQVDAELVLQLLFHVAARAACRRGDVVVLLDRALLLDLSNSNRRALRFLFDIGHQLADRRHCKLRLFLHIFHYHSSLFELFPCQDRAL